jgi:hypothetical protein
LRSNALASLLSFQNDPSYLTNRLDYCGAVVFR